jgi:hypothetical protein
MKIELDLTDEEWDILVSHFDAVKYDAQPRTTTERLCAKILAAIGAARKAKALARRKRFEAAAVRSLDSPAMRALGRRAHEPAASDACRRADGTCDGSCSVVKKT